MLTILKTLDTTEEAFKELRKFYREDVDNFKEPPRYGINWGFVVSKSGDTEYVFRRRSSLSGVNNG